MSNVIFTNDDPPAECSTVGCENKAHPDGQGGCLACELEGAKAELAWRRDPKSGHDAADVEEAEAGVEFWQGEANWALFVSLAGKPNVRAA